jgi:UDP-glucuronate 4-epimerase
LFASSSSVYGTNTHLPFSVHDNVDHPISLYGATKKANELMAHAYAHLFRLPATGLRFFTVYGPWGRPDMAMWIFADAIIAGRPIKVFNQGQMRRDFTYIDDAGRAVLKLVDQPPQDGGEGAGPPAKIYNVGNNHPEELTHVVAILERQLGRPAVKEMLPMQPGDVPATYADIDASQRDLGFAPTTPISAGIPKFIAWFKDYYGVS